MINSEIADQLREHEVDKLRREFLEHSNVLLAIQAIIKTPEGRNLFRYFFKSFDVMEMPPTHLKGEELHGYLGLLKAGNSIFQLASEAASEPAAQILAKIQRERYEDKLQQYRIEQGQLIKRDRDGSGSDDE